MDSDAAIVPTEALAPDTRSLNEIADSAWRHVGEMESSRDNWNHAVLALGQDLIEARQRHPDNQGFGDWLASHSYFGFSSEWLRQIRLGTEYALATGLRTTDEPLHIKELAKKARSSQRKAKRDEKREATKALPPIARYQSHVTDITQLHHKVQGPVDVIVTDPPYPQEYLWTFGELARQAKALLKPGGLCVVMSGQSYLPAVMAYLAEHLDYYWTGAYMLPGQPTPLRQRNVNCSWKPLLIYTNGDANPRLFGDVMTSERNEKDWHDWGQSISGMLDIVDRLTEPGDLILDPFLGGGATAVAALELDRRFVGADVDEEQVKLSDARVGEWFDGTTT